MTSTYNITIKKAWDTLLNLGVSEQTLNIITKINGYNVGTLEDVLYAHTGYRDFAEIDD